MKHLSSLLLFLVISMIAPSAMAVPGIDGLRWTSQYQAQGSWYPCDLSFQDQAGYTYPSGAPSVDGGFTITNYSTNPDGTTARFNGTWSRGGDGGPFNFTVTYNNGQPTALTGFYSGQSTGGMMLQWNAW